MIAVYDHCAGLFAEDYLLDRLCPSEKSRLQTLELYQHTQQRSDDVFARENQHRTQRKPAKKGRS